MDELVEERRERVLLVTLNRPKRLNSFTPAQYTRLADVLNRARDDDSVSALVITGAGRAFSSGADLSIFEDPELAERAVETFGTMLEALTSFDKPLLAAVNGLAVGIGATLLLHCDIVLACPDTRLRYPFSEMGVPPEAGSSYLLPMQVGWQRAAELFFDAGWVESAHALELGLVSRILPPEELVDSAIERATEFSKRSLPALRAAKSLLLEHRREAVQSALARETEHSRRLSADNHATS